MRWPGSTQNSPERPEPTYGNRLDGQPAQCAELLLPADLLDYAKRSGNEYAWAIDDVPDVIEGARLAGFVSIGGQLQFLLPGGICECYWVEVDTHRAVSTTLAWPDKVVQTAAEALTQFRALQNRFDFIAEGRKAFGPCFDAFEASGGDLKDAMCFVWYVEAEHEGQAS